MMFLAQQVPTPQEIDIITATLTSAIDKYGTPIVVLAALFVFGWLVIRYMTMARQQEGKVDEVQAGVQAEIVKQLGILVNKLAENADRHADLNERFLGVAQAQTDALGDISQHYKQTVDLLKTFHDELPTKLAGDVRQVAQDNLKRYNEGQKDIADKQFKLTEAVNALEEDGAMVKEKLQEIENDVKAILSTVGTQDSRLNEFSNQLKEILDKINALLKVHDTQEMLAVSDDTKGET